MHKRRPALVFDLNGTLLDTAAIRPQFERTFGDGQVLEQWLGQLLLYSQSLTLTGEFVEFGEIARSVLRMIATARGVTVGKRELEEFSGAMQCLPAFAEVPQALWRLRTKGFRPIVLTNSGSSSLKKQARNAGISEFFEELISVDEIKRYKPSGEIYRYAADELDLRTRDLLMVAAHPWDLMGARKAGCEVAFVRRPGRAWIPMAKPPDFTGSDLDDLATQLLAKYPSVS
jgi:2-haloacid dehalogenase